jgi:phosphoribosyl 1,2-cyclic phosphodiesterase
VYDTFRGHPKTTFTRKDLQAMPDKKATNRRQARWQLPGLSDFHIQPFELRHNPVYPTYGFSITCQGRKIVIATDFLDWTTVFEPFLDADFIFVESNHDLGLLRQYYNPNSRFHLPNPAAAEMLVTLQKEGRKAPRQVILGHLSDQRNEARLALAETERAFQDAGMTPAFHLSVAPLKTPGPVMCVN